MAGIYIHVPFCTKRCYYCDFYSSVNTRLTDEYVHALLQEIEGKQHFFSNYSKEEQIIRTIYFGGGTPSLLSLESIKSILQKLANQVTISEKLEMTFEVNPDDLSLEYLMGLKTLGINRLSIGIQSFDDGFLKMMNRRHNSKQAESSIEMALKVGIDNISIDLIYALPGLSNDLWKDTLEKAFSFPVKHISAYHLGIEKGTVFGNWLKKGKIKETDEEISLEQFKMLNETAINFGFEHYEISNLALPGFRSKHNGAYWNNVPYLGLGPAAHSFNGTHRFWNVSSINKYVETTSASFGESEMLTTENQLHEYIMTRLRTTQGIDLRFIQQQFGIEERLKIENYLKKYVNASHFEILGDYLRLSLKGWFTSDRIIAEIITIK